MERISFTDYRGDEYIFVRYTTDEITVTKKKPHSNGFHKIEFSSGATKELRRFLGV